MTPDSLPAALRACASGLYAAEAAAGMLIAHAAWLDRDDFSQFIHADPAAEMAAIDWTAAITALTTGKLPSSNGFSERNIQILVKAVLHASGQRQFPPAP